MRLIKEVGRNYNTVILPEQLTTVAWASVTSTPTTLSGYGITDAIGGSGTANYIPKFTASGTISNSVIYETATNILIGSTTDNGAKLQVSGSATISNGLIVTNRTTSYGNDTSNEFNALGFETVGNGTTNTIFPGIGFHQPFMYASTLELRAAGDFRFYNQGHGSYANITAGYGTFSNRVTISASNAAYLRGGDDHEWWDINVANTGGLYGLQDSTKGGLKLGSGGPTLYGTNSNLLIGSTTDSGERLQVTGTAKISSTISASSYYSNGVELITSDGSANYLKTGATLYIQSGSSTVGTISNAGAATFNSTIKTGAPTNGTAETWKLGEATSDTGSVYNTLVRVEIDGVVYFLMAVAP